MITLKQFMKREEDIMLLDDWIKDEYQKGSLHKAIMIYRVRERMLKKQCQSQ